MPELVRPKRFSVKRPEDRNRRNVEHSAIATSVFALDAKMKARFREVFDREPSDFELALTRRFVSKGARCRWYKSESGEPTLRVYNVKDAGTPEAKIFISDFSKGGENGELRREGVVLDGKDLNIDDLKTSGDADLVDRTLADRTGTRLREPILDSHSWSLSNRDRKLLRSSDPRLPDGSLPRTRAEIKRKLMEKPWLKKAALGGGAGVAGLGGALYLWLSGEDDASDVNGAIGVDRGSSDRYYADAPLVPRGSVFASSREEDLPNSFSFNRSRNEKIARIKNLLNAWALESGNEDFDELVCFDLCSELAELFLWNASTTLSRDMFNLMTLNLCLASMNYHVDKNYRMDIIKQVSSRAIDRGAASKLPVNDLLAHVEGLVSSVDLV